MNIAVAVWVFLFGLAVGSFLNVCIYRLPRGESVAHPRSHCPRCGAGIAAYDNIPVLSYLLLGGRCRKCKARISVVYPVVELATGLAFLGSYFYWGFSGQTLKICLFSAALIALIFTDLRERLLPDRINFPFMAIGALFALWVPVGDGTAGTLLRASVNWNAGPVLLSVLDAGLGAGLGAGILYGLGAIWYRLRGIEAMGLGDVKMMAVIGLFLGVKLTVLTLLLGSLGGSLLGGSYILISGKDTQYELPLGTFLGLAALVAAFWGRGIIAAYLSLFPS